MAHSDLDRILRQLRDSVDNRTEFDEKWSQGRSAFGGLSAAFAVTAMGRIVPADIPIRSLMVSFIAPIPPGEVSVKTQIQRQGKNVLQISADVFSEGKLCLQAMGVYGRSRAALEVTASAEFNPLPRDKGIPFSAHTKRVPSFIQYFDGCWAGGGLPFTGNAEPELNLWAKHQVDMDEFRAEAIIAIADVPPPVVLSYFDRGPVQASSLTWSLEFLIAPSDLPMDWFYLHFDMEAAADGYTQQSGKIFTEDGKLCALSRQCMVYFEPPSTS